MNRIDLFVKYWIWQLETTDCDSSLAMMNYLFDRMELNTEQKYWVCWLFMNTYQLPSAWVIYNEFPDYRNVDLDRLAFWTTKHFTKLPYQNDCKWNKGHLHEMFKSYKEVVGPSQRKFFNDLCIGSPTANFQKIYDIAVNKMHKVGRYMVWFYLQTLKHCAGLKVDAPNLLLREHSSEAHRNGLMFALGKDDWTSRFYVDGKKHKRDIKIDERMWEYLDEGAAHILKEAKRLRPSPSTDYFGMESSLCSFQKLFRERDGRYLGYYLARQAEDIAKTESMGWPGVDFQLLRDYRKEMLDRRYTHDKVKKEKFGEILRTGKLPELSMLEHVNSLKVDSEFPEYEE